jgi:uncharacterized RDD family membrane protein YckC
MTSDERAVDYVTMQGNYAGSVSRLAAFAIDLAIYAGLFSLALTVISFAAKVLTRQPIDWHRGSIALSVIFVAGGLSYLGYMWAASGRSLGMAVLGVRVVRQDGTVLGARRAALRALVFPLSFIFFGLGLIGIVLQREHRALHDLMAGTAVVYSWDARAARLRSLAQQAQAGGAGSPPASREDIDAEGQESVGH